MTLFGVTYLTGRTSTHKLQIGLGIVTAGALVTLLWKWGSGAPAKVGP